MAHNFCLILILILRLFLDGYVIIKYDNMLLHFISVAFTIRQSYLL